MRAKISLIIVFFLLANPVFAEFQLVHPDAFRSPIRRFFERVWECKWRMSCYQKFGAFSTLATSDTLNTFPTTYNSNLDRTIEVGTTSVDSITALPFLTSIASTSNNVTIGLISSSTWRGNLIEGRFGGTGTSSMSQYRLVMGNGANTNLTIATSTGTSGQFLTSNGAGQFPYWSTSAIDLTADRTWTGAHTFNNATTTFNATTSIASSWTAPIRLNTVDYVFPSATSTPDGVLGIGTTSALSWVGRSQILATSTTDVTFSNSNATNTLITTSIPGRIVQGNVIRFRISIDDYDANTGSDSFNLAVDYGNQTIIWLVITNNSGVNAANLAGYIDGQIYSNSQSSHEGVIDVFLRTNAGFAAPTAGTIYFSHTTGTATTNSGVAQTFKVDARFATAAASEGMSAGRSYVVLERLY